MTGALAKVVHEDMANLLLAKALSTGQSAAAATILRTMPASLAQVLQHFYIGLAIMRSIASELAKALRCHSDPDPKSQCAASRL